MTGHSPLSPHRQRWTIHVCPGCGSYASPHDLEPRFGNIVAHDDLLEECLEAAKVVEVVPAAAADRLAEALERIRDHGQTHDEPCYAIHNGDCAEKMQEIARSALSEYHSQKATDRV